MKVLHVTPSYFPAFVYGGPIRSTHQLNLALADLGVEIRVLTTDANGQDVLPESGKRVQYHEHLTVQYERRNIMPDISIGLLLKLPGLVQWADVVHLTAVYSFTTIPTLFWSRLLGKPVFWSPRGALQEWEGSPRRGLKAWWDAACKLAAGGRVTIVAASEREAEAARRRFPNIQKEIISNGVVIPMLAPRHGVNRLRLLFLGRIHPVKGIENLLEACALLIRERDREFLLTVAGPASGPYLSTLREVCARLEIAGLVEFVGPVEEEAKGKLFAEHDILVLPSHSENFGLVVAEALAHGLPVIASEGTPWQGLPLHGCGLWVKNDAASLCSAIRDLSGRDLLMMGSKGREWMQREFAWEKHARSVADLYAGRTQERSTP